VRAGAVVVNDVIVPTADPRFPFSGRGRSGFGATRGAEGLLEMTQVKGLAVRSGGSYRHLDELRPGDEDAIAGYVRAAHGGSLRERLAGALAILGSRSSPPSKIDP
jgi:hypothetical protein